MPPQQGPRPGFNDPIDEINPPVPPVGAPLTPTQAPLGPTPTGPRRAGFNDAPAPPDPLQQTLTQARTTTPDAAARIYALRLKTGLPADVIARNLDTVEKQAAAADFDPVKFRKQTPLLATWLQANPQHAAIAHEDLQPLGAIEKALQVGANSVRALGAGGFSVFTVPTWSALEVGSRLVGADSWAQYFGQAREQANQIVRTTRGEQSGAGPLEQAFYSGWESLGQSLPATLMGAPEAAIAGAGESLAGKTALRIAQRNTLSIIGLTTGLQAVGQALDAGKTPWESLVFGYGQGGVEVLTEMLPMHLFLGDLAQHAGLAKLLLHQAASEVPTEEIATVFQDFNEWATLHPDLPFQSYLDARPGAAAQTLVAVVTMVGVQAGVGHVINRVTNTSESQRTIDALTKAAGESKTRERSPAAFHDFVSAAAKGGLKEITVDAAPFGEYFQKKGLDPEQVATQLTGDPTAYTSAITGKGELVIPTANYLSQIPGSGHEAFFAEEVRLGPDAKNTRETKQLLAERAAQPAPTAPTPTPEQQARGDAAESIYTETLAKLTATGRFTPLEAETQATLYASVFDAAGYTTHTDPLQIFRTWAGVTSEGGALVSDAARMRNNALFGGEAGIPDSLGGRHETPSQQTARFTGHTAALTQHVVADALRTDPTADPAAIADQVQRRIEMHAESQSAAIESGQDPGAFLRAIVGAGGIHPTPRSGMFQGEIKHLMESSDPRRRGRRGAIGPLTWKGVAGLFGAERGKTLDGIREALVEAGQLDPDATINDLIDKLTTALSVGSVAGAAINPSRFAGSEGLPDLGIALGTRWWDQAPARPEDYAQKGPQGPANAKGESAYFIGYMEGAAGDAPIALYQVGRDTFDATQLAAKGIPIPETPARVGEPQQASPARTPITEDELAAWAEAVRQRPGIDQFSVELIGTDLLLELIVVDPDERSSGIGTATMHELMALADTHGQRLLLILAAPQHGWGTTSTRRLRRFYGRLGFVDYVDRDGETPADMVREPKAPRVEYEQKDVQKDRNLAPPAASRAYIESRFTLSANQQWGQDVLDANARLRGDNPDAPLVIPPEKRGGMPAEPPAPVDFTAMRRRRPVEFEQDDRQDVPMFYSRLARAVEGSTLNAASGAQWKATIRNAKIGIDRDEFGLTKIDDLEDGAKYTKQEVLDYLKQNAVTVQVTTLGNPPLTPGEEAYRTSEAAARLEALTDQIHQRNINEQIERLKEREQSPRMANVDVHENDDGEWEVHVDDEVDDTYDTQAEAVAAAGELQEKLDDQTMENWTTDVASGVDRNLAYTEAENQILEESNADDPYSQAERAADAATLHAAGYTVVRNPEDPMMVAAIENDEAGIGDFLSIGPNGEIDGDPAHRLPTPALMAFRRLERPLRNDEPRFDDPRYKTPGGDPGSYREVFLTAHRPVAPPYVSAFTDAERAEWRALMQTDQFEWTPAQQARADALLALAPTPVQPYQPLTWQDGHDAYADITNPIARLRFDTRTVGGRRILYLQEVQPPLKGQFEQMPALFQKRWREIAMKWALRHAVDEGLDGVAWTNGKMQADRYDLSKEVDNIRWVPHEMTIPDRFSEGHGDRMTTSEVSIELKPTGDVWQLRIDKDGVVLDTNRDASRLRGERLDAIIGKEHAATILGAAHGAIEQEGLKIGGLGLARLYDEVFPSLVKKLPAVKAGGGQVGKLAIDAGNHPPPRFSERGAAQGFARGEGMGDITPGDLRERFEAVDGARGNDDPAEQGAMAAAVDEIVSLMHRQRSYEQAVDELSREISTHEDGSHEALIKLTTLLGFGGQWSDGAPDQTKAEVPYVAITDQMRESISGGQALAQNPGGGADTRGSFNPATRLIRLFKTANRSTFLHESAHLFLEVYSELAAGEHTTPQLQADMGTLLDFFGFQGDLAAWRAQTDEQRRGEHEKFARAFEKYLGEGRAPTPQLQRVFARFRAWFLGVYKSLRNSQLGPDLSPAVRGVMDRMVAADDAIHAAQQDARVAALFTTAEDAGMTQQEWAGYRDQVQAASDEAQARLEARVMRDLERAEEQWWQDERAAMRVHVAAAVAEEPVYRALAGMRGTLKGQTATPLSRESVVGQFGRAVLDSLPRPYVYSADSGLPADTVAELYGYPSGEALIDDVLYATPIDTVIDARTDERMERDHGDLFRDPSRLQEAARQAVADLHRDAVVRTELATLNTLRKNAAPSVRAATIEQKTTAREGAERLRSEMPDAATLQRLAEQQISGMRLAAIRPERFFAAARRGSTEASQAAALGDFDTAVEAKQTELVNLALFREATAARQAVDRARETFAKMFGPDAAMAKQRDMDYVAAARAVAASYFWPEKRLDTATEALKLIKTHDPELYEMLEEQISGAQASGTELASLTYESFIVMRDAVDALWDQSRRVQQSLIDGRLFDLGEIQNGLGEQLTAIGAAPEETYHSRLQLALLGMRAAMTRVEHWARYVDGGNPRGPFTRFLWNPIAGAAATYRIHKAEYLQKYVDLMKTIEGTLTPGPIAAPELGFTFGLEDGNGRAALLHALLHTGNESNFQKLLRGYKWAPSTDDGALDRSQWDAFLVRAHREGIITRADWDFVQKVWDLVASVKPEAQAAHKEMYGRYFSEITAWPVATPFGTYAGGYVPALVDPLRVANASINAEKEALAGNDNAAMFPTGGKGFTKARQEQYARPLALNLRLIPSHLDKVLRFIHIEPRVKDVGRLLWTHSMRDRLNAYDPTVIQDLLIPWLQRSATQRVTKASQGHAGRGVDQVFRTMRARTGLNMMAGHVMNTLQQFTGGLIATVNVKPRYLRNALWRYTTQHESFMETVASSAWMQTRMTPAAFELQQSLEDILLNPTKYETAQAWGQKHGYVLQQFTQSMVDHVVWAGAYEQATELHDATHEEAVHEADAMVRLTQGSFDSTDIAKFEATIPFIRAFTMFSGYFNMLANFNGTELALVVRDLGLRKGAGRALWIYTFGFMLPAVLSEAITQSISGFPDADDDDSWLDEFLRLFFGSQIRTATAMIPFAGQVATAAYNYYATNSPADDRISSSPVITTLESTVRAPGELYHAIVDEGSKRKAVRDTLDFLGLLTGLPFGAIKRPAGYLADVYDEKEQPDTAGEFARGLVSGRPQDNR